MHLGWLEHLPSGASGCICALSTMQIGIVHLRIRAFVHCANGHSSIRCIFIWAIVAVVCVKIDSLAATFAHTVFACFVQTQQLANLRMSE